MKGSPTFAEIQAVNEEPTALAAVADPSMVTPANPMSLLAAAVERGVDPAQLEKLMELQERYERNRAAEAFAEALAKFQANCPPIFKGRSGAHGARFAGFDDIMAKIRPVLAECGLSVSFDTEHTDGKTIKATCILKHGIHEHRTGFTCPVATDLKANASQQYGSALSYVKRYSLCAALNIVVTDEDDDGNKGGGAEPTITEDQAIQLEEMMESYAIDKEKFWKWMDEVWPGLQNIREIPAKLHRHVYTMVAARKPKGGA